MKIYYNNIIKNYYLIYYSNWDRKKILFIQNYYLVIILCQLLNIILLCMIDYTTRLSKTFVLDPITNWWPDTIRPNPTSKSFKYTHHSPKPFLSKTKPSSSSSISWFFNYTLFHSSTLIFDSTTFVMAPDPTSKRDDASLKAPSKDLKKKDDKKDEDLVRCLICFFLIVLMILCEICIVIVVFVG